ncbi:MAG: family 20 glycosylhydrolase, partial [Clostridia bacterium]|nr:family 20 glycosylhydrolase [Clostridia bacterium]
MRKLTAFLMSFLLCVPFLSLAGLNASGGETASHAGPSVLPALRKWTGSGNAVFRLDGNTVLVDGTKTGVGERAAEFFKELCGREPVLKTASAGKNEIRFELVKKLPSSMTNADEGYVLDIREDAVTVQAKTYKGLLYGAISVVQMCFGDGKGETIACGYAEDEPAYGIRTGLIDVARAWIPLDELEKMVKYMAWFKMSEVHLHLSDNTAFRLESDVPGLATVVNGEKRYYGKDEYRAFVKRMLTYGITVVSEIDTPAHSAPFANVTSGGPAMIQGRFLDITEAHYDDTLAFVKKLWDEYLKGDDPVFVNKVVSIGTDEYLHDDKNTYNEPMRKYTADLGAYIHGLGYTPSNWAFLGKDGFPGDTPVPSYIRADMWDNGISGLEQLVEGGYDLVNMLNARLYVVPGEAESGGFPDRMNVKGLYESWQVWIFGGWGIDKSVPADYKHLLGAGFALWNDYHTQNRGMTRYDIFDRLRDMTCLVAEKTWCGGDTAERSVDDFLRRNELLGKRAGSADPGYHALQEPVNVDFANELPDGFAATGQIEDGKLILDGNAWLSYERGGVGFPNTLTVTLYLEETPSEPLFAGAGFAFYANANGSGKMGYTIEDNLFLFDAAFPVGREVTLTISGGTGATGLLIDGEEGYDAYNSKNKDNNRMETFVLPLEYVGKGAKGYIRSLTVSHEEIDWRTVRVSQNLALNRPVTVSGTEVPDNHLAAWAVDGNTGTRLSFARDKDEQWLIVDLGFVTDVRKIEIQFFERVMSYDVFASADGESYTQIYGFRPKTHEDEDTEHTAYLDAISLEEPVSARYIKYVQNKRWYHTGWSTYYSGGISEFRVFAFDEQAYRKLREDGLAYARKLDRDDPVRKGVVSACSDLDDYLKNKNLYRGPLNRLTDRIAEWTNGEVAPAHRMGDVNGDGRVSAADYRLVKAHLSGTANLSGTGFKAADADVDGQ